MQFLVLSRRRTEAHGEADFDRVIPEETDHVRRLYAAGILRQIWLRADLPGACFILETDDLTAAEATVNALPMAASDLAEFTVIPLTPYRGFAHPP